MNKKLLLALQDKCKDFGLSRAAIEDLAKSGSEGITDDTSDEDISKKADSLSVFAKLMQAEITRKAQKADPTSKPQQQTTTGGNGGGAGEPKTGDDEPAWFKAFKAENDKKLSELQAENNSLKTEKAKAERLSLINSTAAKLGIPQTLMKHFALADDADVEKEMTAFKQELVVYDLCKGTNLSANHNLLAHCMQLGPVVYNLRRDNITHSSSCVRSSVSVKR